jgi:hypothetical protein
MFDIGLLKDAVELIGSFGRSIHVHSATNALSQIRRQNNNCMHILVDAAMMVGHDWQDTSGSREINETRGMFFGSLGHQFYHPDPSFTPNNPVEVLVRTRWNPGGLNPEWNNVPVVSADRLSYHGCFWRQTAGDRGGGSIQPGRCRLCAQTDSILTN